MAFSDYVKGGAVVGGVICAVIASYTTAKAFMPIAHEMFPDSISGEYGITGLTTMIAGIAGGISGLAVGAAGGAVVGGVKKGLEAIVRNVKS